MRNWFTVALLLYCLALMTLLFKNNEAYDQMVREYESEKQIYQDNKESLEKEIRLLKTDIYILENGFEEVTLDK